MAIILCPNGHYYDDLKSPFCPYCQKPVSSSPDDALREQLTEYGGFYAADYEPDGAVTEGYDEFVEDDQKTIGIYYDEESMNILTVGWLVALTGVEKGKSYVIHSGRNYVGRDDNMDISLREDIKISRDTHFTIIYDPKSVCFYVTADNGLIWVNNKSIKDEAQLFEGDVIKAGDNEYIFIPYCKEGRVWK